MHREHLEEKDDATIQHKPRLLIQDRSTFDADETEKPALSSDGRLSGPYKHVSSTLSLVIDDGMTNARLSILSSAQHLLYVFSLHLHHFVSPAYSSRVSLTGLVAVTVSAPLLATRSQTAHAV